MEPLGVRVVTLMTGSADTPMFGKPSGRLNLPETSYYYGVQDAAYKERMDHQKKAMKVNVLAEHLVKDILSGTKGPIWRGALATLVRVITSALPAWVVDKLVNAERGIKEVKHR